MGLLDGLFGGGQQQGQQGQQQPQGIAPDTFWDRFRAQYAPGAYAAHQGNLQQQAIYAAMLKNKASPEQAQALAMSPQFFQAASGAYLPGAPTPMVLTNSDQSQTPVQISHPGGGPNQSLSLSGLPITAPGTTANPTQAASGASGRPAPQQQAQDNTQGSANATPAAPDTGPTNTLQGMPGSTQAILDAIDRSTAAGQDPFSVVPKEFRNITNAVMSGQMTLNEIPQTRGSKTREIVLKLAQQIDPNFSEAMNEARNIYRKGYTSSKPGDLGSQIKSIDTLSAHAEGLGDAALNLPNIGLGGSDAAHIPNMTLNWLRSTPQAALKSAADKYANELSTFLSGKANSSAEERKDRAKMYASEKTPQEMGQALLTDIDFLQKRLEANEQHRNAVFADSKMQEQFPLASPQARAHLDQARIKAHKLLGDYDEWSKTSEGITTLGGKPPVNPSLPNGWKLVK